MATIANPMQVHIIAIGTWMPIRLSLRASQMTIHISPMTQQASPTAFQRLNFFGEGFDVVSCIGHS